MTGTCSSTPTPTWHCSSTRCSYVSLHLVSWCLLPGDVHKYMLHSGIKIFPWQKPMLLCQDADGLGGGGFPLSPGCPVCLLVPFAFLFPALRKILHLHGSVLTSGIYMCAGTHSIESAAHAYTSHRSLQSIFIKGQSIQTVTRHDSGHSQFLVHTLAVQQQGAGDKLL